MRRIFTKRSRNILMAYLIGIGIVLGIGIAWVFSLPPVSAQEPHVAQRLIVGGAAASVTLPVEAAAGAPPVIPVVNTIPSVPCDENSGEGCVELPPVEDPSNAAVPVLNEDEAAINAAVDETIAPVENNAPAVLPEAISVPSTEETPSQPESEPQPEPVTADTEAATILPEPESVDVPEAEALPPEADPTADQYTLGIDDILEINVIQPDQISQIVTVSADGYIYFPYIGGVKVKGKNLTQVQEEIESRLADGYMKYPVIAVSLKESRSRKFFVYGEVVKPGTYPLEENTTVLRAISVAGGFNKYGSSSRVKLLRPRHNEPGYETIKINIKGVMDGVPEEDKVLSSGDILVISEGIF